MFNYVDTIITFVIPVVAIVFLNVCIGTTVWKLAGIRKRLTYRGTSGQKRNTTLVNKRAIAQKKITKMLLVVSTVCLCFNFPSYIMRVLADLIQVSITHSMNNF